MKWLVAALCSLVAVPPGVAGAASKPTAEVRRLAQRAFDCARSRGLIDGSHLALIDYSRPSSERRLWLIDMTTGAILGNELVAHGRNSGGDRATRFSNRSGSKRSSLGLFRAAEPYYGRHGYSLRLDGLEAGFNDRARKRAIVIHGAAYVSDAFVAEHGRLGRSWGCPALPIGANRAIIDRLENGNAVFAYYPDPDWLSQSEFLHCDGNP